MVGRDDGDGRVSSVISTTRRHSRALQPRSGRALRAAIRNQSKMSMLGEFRAGRRTPTRCSFGPKRLVHLTFVRSSSRICVMQFPRRKVPKSQEQNVPNVDIPDVYTSAQLAEIGALAPAEPTSAPATLGSKPTHVLRRHRCADLSRVLDRERPACRAGREHRLPSAVG